MQCYDYMRPNRYSEKTNTIYVLTNHKICNFVFLNLKCYLDSTLKEKMDAFNGTKYHYKAHKMHLKMR